MRHRYKDNLHITAKFMNVNCIFLEKTVYFCIKLFLSSLFDFFKGRKVRTPQSTMLPNGKARFGGTASATEMIPPQLYAAVRVKL